MQWLHNNSQALLTLLYITVLLFIGLMRSPKFWSQLQYFYEQAFDNWSRNGDGAL